MSPSPQVKWAARLAVNTGLHPRQLPMQNADVTGSLLGLRGLEEIGRSGVAWCLHAAAGSLGGDGALAGEEGACNPPAASGHCHMGSETHSDTKNGSDLNNWIRISCHCVRCPPHLPLDGSVVSSFPELGA